MLLIGDDWAEDHHDVEVQDETGRKLTAARLPEGVEGIAKLHELLAKHGGNVKNAAKAAGINTVTLYRLLKRRGLYLGRTISTKN